jgi:hypothetical protein
MSSHAIAREYARYTHDRIELLPIFLRIFHARKSRGGYPGSIVSRRTMRRVKIRRAGSEPTALTGAA